jgi:hypothetical protein
MIQRYANIKVHSITSLFRYGMEPHLAAYTSLGSDTEGTKGMVRMLRATQQEEEQTAWTARPADRAYQSLKDPRVSSFVRGRNAKGKSKTQFTKEEV